MSVATRPILIQTRHNKQNHLQRNITTADEVNMLLKSRGSNKKYEDEEGVENKDETAFSEYVDVYSCKAILKYNKIGGHQKQSCLCTTLRRKLAREANGTGHGTITVTSLMAIQKYRRKTYLYLILTYLIALTLIVNQMWSCQGASSSENVNVINLRTTTTTTSIYSFKKENGLTSIKQGLSYALGIDATPQQRQQQNQQQQTQEYIYTNISSPPSSSSSSLVAANLLPNINDFITRDNVLKRQVLTGEVNTPKSTIPSDYPKTCPSCQMLEKAKRDNLESIKMHIISRLQLTQLPNITTPIQVPSNILENFYNNYSLNGNKHSNAKTRNLRTKSKGKGNSHSHDEVQHQTVYGDVVAGDVVDVSEVMQSDDPLVYQLQRMNQTEITNDNDEYLDEEDPHKADDEDDDYAFTSFEHELHPRIKSVYIFPKTPRLRHNRKTDILNFHYDNYGSTISHAILHIYLRGTDWMKEHNPSALMERTKHLSVRENANEIVINVNRALRRPNMLNFTHTVRLTEIRHKIPTGLGEWIRIESKEVANYWMENGNSTQSIVIRGLESWMRPFIVTVDNSHNRLHIPHIEIQIKEKYRVKRSTSLDCQESDHEVRCCRYPLKVNFTNFGWTFVVAPTSFDAYFCNGECKVGYLEQYTHTHIASLTTSATPCCSPTEMSPLSLLYFNVDQHLVLSTIPNMSVEKCSCS